MISDNSKRYQVRQKSKGKAVTRGIGKAAKYTLQEARAEAKQLMADINQGEHLRTKKALEDYLKYSVDKAGGKLTISAKNRKATEQKTLAVEAAGKDTVITVTNRKRKS